MTWSWYGDPDVGFVCISHLPNVRSKKQYKTLREYLDRDFDYYGRTEGKPQWSWGYRRGGLPGNPLSSWNGIDGNGRLMYDLGKDGFRYALAMAESKDVEFTIDDIICYDGVLKHDPFTDPDAAVHARADDPIWNARPPRDAGQ